MSLNAKYTHTNIVAQDLKRLAQFYEQLFDCVPVPPERDLSGPWLEAGTGLPDAHIRGIHLRLPGGGENGPTLEIFQYNCEEPRPATAINRPGLAHLAFAVADVEAARQAVLDAGGTAVGALVSLEVAGVGRVTFAYVTDPEGNIIELQRWSH